MTRKINQAGFLVLLLVILIGILIIVGSLVYYKSKIRTQSGVQDQQTISSLVTQKPSSALATTASSASEPVTFNNDQTASWKIYTNKKFSYSFKYPDQQYQVCYGLLTNEQDQDEFVVLHQKNADSNCLLTSQIGLSISAESNSGDKSMPRLTILDQCLHEVSEEVKINGVNAAKYSYNIIENAPENPCKTYNQYGSVKDTDIYEIKSNGYLYSLQVVKDQDWEVKQKILSTFKFTQ